MDFLLKKLLFSSPAILWPKSGNHRATFNDSNIFISKAMWLNYQERCSYRPCSRGLDSVKAPPNPCCPRSVTPRSPWQFFDPVDVTSTVLRLTPGKVATLRLLSPFFLKVNCLRSMM